ncbi:hypothetical protein D915_006578 [Fasciola hepatica]|uniref:Uncharacterized protein n=1 Tax=Fasciola hepatica TaxID=6192 RepID=A0A2H1C6I2_FASHE|nr:hypothetical protein D915_006578 [Fasciola hepatica]
MSAMVSLRAAFPLRLVSRNYIPVVIRSKTRLTHLQRMAYFLLFMSPYAVGIGLCHLIKTNPVEYRGPKLVEEK